MESDTPICSRIHSDLTILDELVPLLEQHELEHGDEVSIGIFIFFCLSI